MKLKNVLNINYALKNIIDLNGGIESLAKFRLLGIMKSLEPVVANFETVRNEAIKKYGKEDEEGNYKIDKEDKESIKKFEDEIDRLLETDVEVKKIKADEIFNAGIPAEYLVSIYDIIEE